MLVKYFQTKVVKAATPLDQIFGYGMNALAQAEQVHAKSAEEMTKIEKQVYQNSFAAMLKEKIDAARRQ